jgi:hypothetical protein
MQQTPRHFSRFVNSGAWCAMLAAFSLQAAPAITAVVKNPEPAGKYEKLELTVALTATYTNAYDPDQIDLSAQFTAPSGKLWSSLAAGIAVTPLLWQFNQGWNASVSAQFPAFNKFIADIHFGGLTHPAQAKVAVPDAGAWGITSDQITFGWITGAIAGKSLQVNGLAGGSYRIEWWDCATGTAISTATAAAASGSITSDIPAASQSDLAYKIIHL